MKNETFFRFLYQNRGRGITHSAQIVSAAESYVMIYLCGLCREGNITVQANRGQRTILPGEKIDLLVLDKPGREERVRVLELLKRNDVERIVLPADEEREDWFPKDEPGKFVFLKAGEHLYLVKAGWETRIRCYGGAKGLSLAVYHGPLKTNPGRTDCVMSVKPFEREKPCGLCRMDPSYACALRCGVYNDIDLLKKHNEHASEKYVAGTLLLGRINLEECGGSLFHELDKNSAARGQLRFITLPGGASERLWSKELTCRTDPLREQYNRYFIVADEEGDPASWREIVTASMRYKLLFPTEQYGICAGGFFADRE